jgi:hypothetical protein
MLSECLNPECRKELHYLRDGKVVRVVRQEEERIRVEHFWLCGDCHLYYDFHFSDGEVSVSRRCDSALSGRQGSLDLTLVA